MARRCALTGKEVQYGHNVSHSMRATKRRFEPNIQSVTVSSEILGRNLSLRIAARTLRSIQKKGGIDAFLLGMADDKLMPEGLRLKRQMRKRLAS